MCYRYSVPGPEKIKKTFKVKLKKDFKRHYHTAAFDFPKLPVITNEEPEYVNLYHWGLIPFWVKDKSLADNIKEKTANARSETIFEKPSFRHLAAKKHCLVVSDGFFEWRYYNGKNYPYYIHLKNDEPFAIAGLWDKWINKKNNEEIFTYTIITTDANPLLAKIHNKKKRMPVIIDKKDYSMWLNKNIDKEETKKLLKPYDQTKMKAYTISKFITSKNQNIDTLEVLEPFNYTNLEPLSNQTSLF